MHAIIREGQVYFACEESGAESMFSTDSDSSARSGPSPNSTVARRRRRCPCSAYTVG